MPTEDPPHFFFDTYALIQRERGVPAYEPYRDLPIFTHRMNIYEFIAAVMRDGSEASAREQLRLMRPNYLEAETDDLFASAHFRQAHAQHRISHVDALGYVLARRHGLRFLTGDRVFKGVKNVVYVP